MFKPDTFRHASEYGSNGKHMKDIDWEQVRFEKELAKVCLSCESKKCRPYTCERIKDEKQKLIEKYGR